MMIVDAGASGKGRRSRLKGDQRITIVEEQEEQEEDEEISIRDLANTTEYQNSIPPHPNNHYQQ